MAPEVAMGRKLIQEGKKPFSYYGVPSDIFSLGVILFILVVCRFPYNKDAIKNTYDESNLWNYIELTIRI